MPHNFQQILIEYLDALPQRQPVDIADTMAALNIPAEQQGEFRAAAQQLAAAGRLVYTPARGALSLPPPGQTVTGRYHQTQRGFGFIAPETPNSNGDLFIAAGDNMDALSGDRVVARVVQREKYDATGAGKPRRVSGRIIEILNRGTNRCVGTLEREHKRWFVTPDGTIFRSQISVADAGAKNAVVGDKVVVEVLRFQQGQQTAQGVIVEVLGPHGDPDVELKAVLRKYDLPETFPPEVTEQARRAAQEFDVNAYPDREDLTEEIIATIDPDDARDFDDAISLRVFPHDGPAPMHDSDDPSTLLNGGGRVAFELGVHIADVASFVPVESALDLEARQRGNSVYFPRHVVPMLPELLSNGVCSLQENQPRLTKSAFISYDSHGRVLAERFANTIIRSRKRLTYREAQLIIDDATGAAKPYTKGLLDSPPNPNIPAAPEPVRQLLVNMDRLARAIRRRRLEQGMIVLDLPEVELVMDVDGRVIDAKPEDDAFTHTIIEMFMVEANEAVARFLTRRRLPVLRRIHPEPDAISSAQVRQFVAVSGQKLPAKLDRHVIQGLLDSVRGTPVAYAVHLSILKTFSTAEYSPLELGHYALASENYAHFTSPIRRYADLVIHRALQSILGGREGKHDAGGHAGGHAGARHGAQNPAESFAHDGAAPPTPDATVKNVLMPKTLGNVPNYALLLQLGKHLSFTERRAQDAERDLRAVKVLQFLAQHAGDALDGVVTGVTGFGIFVQSSRFLVEGLIRMTDLPDDYWIFDEASGSLRGERSGRRIALGDRAKVQIVAVNVAARRLDLRLLEHGPREGGAQGLRKFQPRNSPKPVRRHEGSEGRPGEHPRGRRKKAAAQTSHGTGGSGRQKKRGRKKKS